MTLKIPDVLNLGGGELVELEYLQTTLGISRRTAAKYLTALRINPMRIGKKRYFSLPTFKRIMFVLSLPGSPGFLFPGSTGKNDPRLLKDEGYISEVTDVLLEKAARPEILAEMLAAEGRNVDIIKKYVTGNVGRPKKEEKND